MFADTIVNRLNPRVRQRIFRNRPDDSLPHVVAHQRVYIVPTKRGFAFLLAVLLMLVTSVNYALSLGYALCFVLTGLFAATLLHTYKNLVGIEVREIEAVNGFAGDKVEFIVSLLNGRNDNRHGIRLRNHKDVSAMTAIAPDGSHDVKLSVTASRRGRMPLGRLTLQSDWPLGLWTCWSYLHVSVDALVYPQVEPDAPPLPSHETEDLGRKPVAALDGEISGVRDYRAGDAMSSIAWKSAAKGNGLHVRTFENSRSPASAVLTLQSTGHHKLEDQLSRLSAWVTRAYDSRTEYTMELPGSHLAREAGEQHRLRALKLLALYGVES